MVPSKEETTAKYWAIMIFFSTASSPGRFAKEQEFPHSDNSLIFHPAPTCNTRRLRNASTFCPGRYAIHVDMTHVAIRFVSFAVRFVMFTIECASSDVAQSFDTDRDKPDAHFSIYESPTFPSFGCLCGCPQERSLNPGMRPFQLQTLLFNPALT